MTDAENEKRFEGAGQEFHAKYLGVVDVAKSKGQEVCQEAMQKLLVALKSRKEPKPRLIINLTYEGTRLKEMPPGINLMDVTFKHAQVSYVWKDPRDQRSLGIVRAEPDSEDATKMVHRFHGLRTIKPAMPFLQEMQDLFRIVKERSTLQKERSASVAASAAAAAPGAPADASAAPAAAAATAQPTAAAAEAAAPAIAPDPRDRAVSNLLRLDAAEAPGLTKNASATSLEDLGDIFSASATISQPTLPTVQPIGGGAFGQPMGGGVGAFGQPMGGVGGAFGQPMGANPYGQPMGANPYGQPMGANPYGQPMGGVGHPYGQPTTVANPFGQTLIPGNSPMGQPMAGAPFGQPLYRPSPAAAAPTNPFGQQQPFPYGQPSGGPFSPQPTAQQPQFYPQQQPQQQQLQQQRPPAAAPVTNPFAADFNSVFDRSNSVPAGTGDLLTPVTLTPTPGSPHPQGTAAKPDAFGDLLVGLAPGSADPKRQQVSGKDLFRPTDKPKATLRDLANQSPRP